MNSVEGALQELIGAIMNSAEYREFDRQRSLLRNYPGLKEQIDRFRQENYALQRFTEPDQLLDKMDEFSLKYEEFRKNPMVEAFLLAELEFCRMIQEINQKIVEAVNFE